MCTMYPTIQCKGKHNKSSLLPLSQQLEEAFSLMLELHCLETEKEAEDRDTRSDTEELSTHFPVVNYH